MVALPPVPAASPAAQAQGGAPAHPLAPPPPLAPGVQPPAAGPAVIGAMRPDGFILFSIWAGNQAHEVWAHRFWT
eukprot:8051529-Alexandrium_andersonii.AAC.1